MAVPIQRRTITVDEYVDMWENGVFSDDDRVELLNGEVVEMSPIGDRHAACVIFLVNTLASLRPRALLSPQNPLRLPGKVSLPQPDLVLLRPRPDLAKSPITVRDTLLVVEVADSSLVKDRDTKIPIYAASGISESWLIDLNADKIWVYRRPSPRGYQDVRSYRRGDSIAPEAFPEISFQVDEILG
jgi:Uma2 family endonuclease